MQKQHFMFDKLFGDYVVLMVEIKMIAKIILI